MKNKVFVIILFVIFALPIPFSLITILGSLISLANIFMADSILEAIILIVIMLLPGTYSISYIVSLNLTINKKKIGIYSFIPIVHLAVVALIFLL